jgi:hypothetical protein
MLSIVSMIETVGELAAEANSMGYEARRIGENINSNPFTQIKAKYYPESLRMAWRDGWIQYSKDQVEE